MRRIVSRRVITCFFFLLLIYFVYRINQYQNDVINESFDVNQNIASQPDEQALKPTGLYLKNNDPADIQKFVISTVNNALQINSGSQVRGPPGPKGDKGDPGINGGTYQKFGPIRNVKYPSMVIERTNGIGPSSKCFLNDQTYEQWQTWQLGTDNKLRSVFNPNECITFGEDNNVNMTSCVNAEPFSHRKSTGQLQSMREPAKCLSIEKVGKMNTNSMINNSNKKFIENTYVTKMDKCQNIGEQSWQFY